MEKILIAIVDYGTGNVGSLGNMLHKIGQPSELASTPDVLERADAILLPGVGAFDRGMGNLQASGLLETLTRRVRHDGVRVLGICLGMQLLARSSEEGTLPGLGWIDAVCRKFSFPPEDRQHKVPHMGWNAVIPRSGEALFAEMEPGALFYFVHSYHVVCADPGDVLGVSEYGETFTSAVRRDNVFGVQFHPEKSLRFGMRLLRNFCEGVER